MEDIKCTVSCQDKDTFIPGQRQISKSATNSIVPVVSLIIYFSTLFYVRFMVEYSLPVIKSCSQTHIYLCIFSLCSSQYNKVCGFFKKVVAKGKGTQKYL